MPEDQSPEAWVYIEHPKAGRSDNPVQRSSLITWGRLGWTESEDQLSEDDKDKAKYGLSMTAPLVPTVEVVTPGPATPVTKPAAAKAEEKE